jgi:hypothetical protein
MCPGKPMNCSPGRADRNLGGTGAPVIAGCERPAITTVTAVNLRTTR